MSFLTGVVMTYVWYRYGQLVGETNYQNITIYVFKPQKLSPGNILSSKHVSFHIKSSLICVRNDVFYSWLVSVMNSILFTVNECCGSGSASYWRAGSGFASKWQAGSRSASVCRWQAKIYGIWAYFSTFSWFWAFIWKLGSDPDPHQSEN